MNYVIEIQLLELLYYGLHNLLIKEQVIQEELMMYLLLAHGIKKDVQLDIQ
jgi:hypothetical protein